MLPHSQEPFQEPGPGVPAPEQERSIHKSGAIPPTGLEAEPEPDIAAGNRSVPGDPSTASAARFVIRGRSTVRLLHWARALTRGITGCEVRVVEPVADHGEDTLQELVIEACDGRESTARHFIRTLLALQGERVDFEVIKVGVENGAVRHGDHGDVYHEPLLDASGEPMSLPPASLDGTVSSAPSQLVPNGPSVAQQVKLASMLEVAHRYRERGLSIVPQKAGEKHPCVKWKPFQGRLATEAELHEWFVQLWPDAGIACVLGEISGLFVIDVDGKEAHDELVARLGSEPIVPKAMSGSGDPHRYHLFFRYPTGLVTKNKSTPWHPKLEFRGTKGIIILPPSIHKSGNRYRWVDGRALDDLPLTEVPALVRQALEAEAAAANKKPEQPAVPSSSKKLLGLTEVQKLASAYVAKMAPAIQEQNGDKMAYTVACTLVQRFQLSPTEALPLILEWNERCQPPWSEEELVHKLEAADKEPGPRGTLLARGLAKQSRAETANVAADPLLALAPGLSELHDLSHVDKHVATMIETLGGTHGLFAGMGDWKIIKGTEVQLVLPDPQASLRWLLKQFPHGGGFLFRDPDSSWWAVRAVPTQGSTDHSVQLFAIRWTEARRLLYPQTHGGVDQVVDRVNLAGRPTTEAPFRDELRQIAARLRLSRQAEQLLWYIHSQVLQQRSPAVVIADETLAAVLWGSDRRKRPRNWRPQLHAILTSLVLLRWLPGDRKKVSKGFSLTKNRWVVLRSVCLREAQLEEESKSETAPGVTLRGCIPTCPWHHTRGRHRHYDITVGAGFLGGLKAFAKENEHLFDFQPNHARDLAELRQEIDNDDELNNTEKRERFKAGQERLWAEHRARYLPIVSAPLPLMLWGDRLDLQAEHRRLVRALVRETTRARKKLQTDRPDHAHVIRSRRVPGKRRKHLVVCHLLDEGKEYVGFNGNGNFWGRGYSIPSWMERSGYLSVSDESSPNLVRKEVQRFLKDLDHVAQRLGLIVAGYQRDRWFNLVELRQLVRSGDIRKRISRLQLRLFAEHDYLCRWRQAVAEVLNPQSATQDDPVVAILDLKTRLVQVGISHMELARLLGKSRPYISMVLEGKKPCPAALLVQVEALIQGREQPTEPEGW